MHSIQEGPKRNLALVTNEKPLLALLIDSQKKVWFIDRKLGCQVIKLSVRQLSQRLAKLALGPISDILHKTSVVPLRRG